MLLWVSLFPIPLVLSEEELISSTTVLTLGPSEANANLWCSRILQTRLPSLPEHCVAIWETGAGDLGHSLRFLTLHVGPSDSHCQSPKGSSRTMGLLIIRGTNQMLEKALLV